jgi:hypothetical protein
VNSDVVVTLSKLKLDSWLSHSGSYLQLLGRACVTRRNGRYNLPQSLTSPGLHGKGVWCAHGLLPALSMMWLRSTVDIRVLSAALAQR